MLDVNDNVTKISAIGWFKDTEGDLYLEAYSDVQMIGFFVVLIFLGVGLYNIVKCFLSLSDENKLDKVTKKSIIVSIVGISIYTVFTWVFSPINASLGGHTYSKVNIFPLILILLICIVYAVYNSILVSKKNKEVEENLDPDEYILKYGAEAFKNKVNNPTSSIEFLMRLHKNYLFNNAITYKIKDNQMFFKLENEYCKR